MYEKGKAQGAKNPAKIYEELQEGECVDDATTKRVKSAISEESLKKARKAHILTVSAMLRQASLTEKIAALKELGDMGPQGTQTLSRLNPNPNDKPCYGY